MLGQQYSQFHEYVNRPGTRVVYQFPTSHLTFLNILDRQAKLDRTAAFPDGSFVSAKKGGEDIAYGWKGKGSTVHLVRDGNGLPLAFSMTAANVSEAIVGLEVKDRVKVPRSPGRLRQRPASLAADKGYGSADFWWELRRRRIRPSIPRRTWKRRHRKPGRAPVVHETSLRRWKIERSHGWLENWWRLVNRHDWYTKSYFAFLIIACFMVTLARVLG